MKTTRLYYTDSYIKDFTANVISCEKATDKAHKEKFKVILDRTAFYPEGGGQPCDTGILGGASVTDVQKENGEIVHYTDRELIGSVDGQIDFDKRYRRMQGHTGEHIASGIIHTLFGAENIGFHVGSEDVTFDTDIELGEESIRRVEKSVNEAIYANVPIKTSFPTPSELSLTEYRSKLEFAEGTEVRIVEIEGYDRCACSATHVARTGEVGIVIFTSFEKNKGGTRIHMLAGADAFEYIRRTLNSVNETAVSHSVKPEEIGDVLARTEEKLYRAKETRRVQIVQIADLLVGQAKSGGSYAFETQISGKKSSVFNVSGLTNEEMRIIANKATESYDYSLVLSGNDNDGYMFVIISKKCDCREAIAELKTRMKLTGGGKADMASGKIEKIEF